ncbi:hypothetical protein, partial [Zavarzinella formosa]|uniref:hypothetical protein n=1 Tax=Zavarzinella formosa TaxID=360055 RepID=UPI001EE684A4
RAEQRELPGGFRQGSYFSHGLESGWVKGRRFNRREPPGSSRCSARQYQDNSGNPKKRSFKSCVPDARLYLFKNNSL